MNVGDIDVCQFSGSHADGSALVTFIKRTVFNILVKQLQLGKVIYDRHICYVKSLGGGSQTVKGIKTNVFDRISAVLICLEAVGNRRLGEVEYRNVPFSARGENGSEFVSTRGACILCADKDLNEILLEYVG